MRVLTMVLQGLLSQDDIDVLRSVPHFYGTKNDKGGYRSNNYIFDNDIPCPMHYKPDRYTKEVFEPRTIKLSNIIAFFDMNTQLYWMSKNRYTGERGWVSQEVFKNLVMRELLP